MSAVQLLWRRPQSVETKGTPTLGWTFSQITPTLPLVWLKSASEDCGLLETKNNSKQELRQQPVARGHWFKALQQCSVSSVCSYNASLLLSNHVGLCVFQRGHLNQAKTSPGTVMKQAFLNICQALMGPKVLPWPTVERDLSGWRGPRTPRRLVQ